MVVLMLRRFRLSGTQSYLLYGPVDGTPDSLSIGYEPPIFLINDLFDRRANRAMEYVAVRHALTR